MLEENSAYIPAPMQVTTDEELLTIVDRISKLSRRPDNPGMAYRNLETINALIYSLNQKLRNKFCQ